MRPCGPRYDSPGRSPGYNNPKVRLALKGRARPRRSNRKKSPVPQLPSPPQRDKSIKKLFDPLAVLLGVEEPGGDFVNGGEGRFLGIHCFTKYVKVAFFRGASLRPVPPGEAKQKEIRYLDVREDDQLDEAQFAS